MKWCSHYISLSQNENLETYVERFSIDMSDWSLIERTQRTNEFPNVFEFSSVNYAYSGLEYQYGYMMRNPWTASGSILKVSAIQCMGRMCWHLSVGYIISGGRIVKTLILNGLWFFVCWDFDVWRDTIKPSKDQIVSKHGCTSGDHFNELNTPDF